MHRSLFLGAALATIFMFAPDMSQAEAFSTSQASTSFPTSDSAAAGREAIRRAQNGRQNQGARRHTQQPPMADTGGRANMLIGGTRPHTGENSRNRNRNQHNGGNRNRNRDHNSGNRNRNRDHGGNGRYRNRGDHNGYANNRDHRRYGNSRDHRRYGNRRGHSRSSFSINIGTGYGSGLSHGSVGFGYGHGYGSGYGRNFRDHGYFSLLGGHNYRSSYDLYPWWYGDTLWGYRDHSGYRSGYGHIGHSNVYCADYSHQNYTVNWQDPYSDHHAFSPYSNRTNASYGGYNINSCRLENRRGWFNGQRAIVRSTVCWDKKSRSYVDTGARQLIDFY